MQPRNSRGIPRSTDIAGEIGCVTLLWFVPQKTGEDYGLSNNQQHQHQRNQQRKIRGELWRSLAKTNCGAWPKTNIRYLAILCDLFGVVKWPFKCLSDLSLGDQKVTLNHLVLVNWCFGARCFKHSDWIPYPAAIMGSSWLDFQRVKRSEHLC